MNEELFLKDSLRCYWLNSEKELLVHLQTLRGLKIYVLKGVQRKMFRIFLNTELESGVIEISDEDSNVFRVFIEDLLMMKEN